MSEPEPPFASLIGRITPIKQKPAAAGFGRAVKTRQIRRIAAQNQNLENAGALPANAVFNPDNLTDAQIQHMRELRVPLAREIDLHGFFVDEALRYLSDCLHERRNRRPEYWLIVHGKGKNSPHYDVAPLKNAVLETLLSHAAVGAAVPVLDSRGEAGAVLIRLRAKEKRIL